MNLTSSALPRDRNPMRTKRMKKKGTDSEEKENTKEKMDTDGGCQFMLQCYVVR